MEAATPGGDALDRSPDVAMTVSLASHPDSVAATVTLVGFGSDYAATAEARRSHQNPDPHIEYELAVSRALSRLQHDIMEAIHRRIDRTADDI